MRNWGLHAIISFFLVSRVKYCFFFFFFFEEIHNYCKWLLYNTRLLTTNKKHKVAHLMFQCLCLRLWVVWLFCLEVMEGYLKKWCLLIEDGWIYLSLHVRIPNILFPTNFLNFCSFQRSCVLLSLTLHGEHILGRMLTVLLIVLVWIWTCLL